MRRFFLLIFFMVFIVFNNAVFAACTGPAGVPGDIIYNGTYDVFQGCSAQGWVAFHPPFFVLDCPDIGDACQDGSVYAGMHPTLGERLYIPPIDQGKVQWKTSRGINDIASDSMDDGKINDSQIPAGSTEFPAFKLCREYTLGGKDDWYLPSRDELQYLGASRNLIASKGNITNYTQSAYYHSSTEYNSSFSYAVAMTSGGGVGGYYKNNSYNIRCVRR